MCVDAETRLSNHQVVAVKPLLDTGASANYMSTAFFNRHKDHFLQVKAPPADRQVRLGDGVTLKSIRHLVKFKMRFGFPGQPHDIIVEANVFDNDSHDLIIGARTLVHDLLEYFIRLLRQLRLKTRFNDESEEDALYAIMAGDLVRPFPFISHEAPEEAISPMPSHGSEYLLAMEVDYDERRDKYLALLGDPHISPGFLAACPQLMDMLKTKGVQVFVAHNWNGIKDMKPVEFEFHNLPDSHNCKVRNINPELAKNFYAELERLKGYLFDPSDSPIVSPIVVAHKATFPFIRVCGDFTWINKYIVMPIVPIPHVISQLAKISNYKYFIDMDVTNAFHQIPIGPITSRNLSIVTPGGTFKPKFLLEGTTPATGILHSTMVNMFKEFEDWSIVLFDNVLILCDSYEDAYEKLNKFLDKCIERNVFLKFEKSWLGVEEVKFFGYLCKHKKYEMTMERQQSILEIPFPQSVKQMQSFLGSCLFFKNFIPDYSEHSAVLNDMTHKAFQWIDETKWTVDYRAAFDNLKQVVAKSFTLFYPDYTLTWILRVDASQHGVGSVLLQIKDGVLQPIMFNSAKFSPQAMNWSTIEQECYAIFFAVFQNVYYLRCKHFIIETDHRNLQWMWLSKVPKIIRWHIYLQSFDFVIRHIPGKTNIVADMLSRQWPSAVVREFNDALHHLLTVSETRGNNFESVMRQVHGRRAGHRGALRTWHDLNRLYPGHGFSFIMVTDWVAECPQCQKVRMAPVPSIPPTIKTLHSSGVRDMVCIDTLTCVRDTLGNQYLLVFINNFTRYAKLYPVKDKGAETTATCIVDYIANYGLFTSLRMDPGSDFTSKVVEHLLKWLGPTRSFTLVDNPEANGVEATNREILRHLKALCLDENCKHQWSHPTVLPIIQLILNEHVHSETGVIPFQAHFGDADAIYSQIPSGLSATQATHAYVRLLSDNLKMIRKISADYQASIHEKRTAERPPTADNHYQRGDYVTYGLDKMKRMDKFTTRNQGPFKVLQHVPDSNWLEVEDLVTGNKLTLNLKDVSIFCTDEESAQKMANYDHDQHQVDVIIGHRGNPELRTSMVFLVRFADLEVVEKLFKPDLCNTKQFSDYCTARPELQQLLMPAKQAELWKKKEQKAPINRSLAFPGHIVFIDLRSWGPGKWYAEEVSLPHKDTLTYVLECRYGEYVDVYCKRIRAYFPALDATWNEDNWFVVTYGHKYVALQSDHVLLTEDLIRQHKLELV